MSDGGIIRRYIRAHPTQLNGNRNVAAAGSEKVTLFCSIC
jgi:hypothetical protein